MSAASNIIAPEIAVTLSGLFHERVRRSPQHIAYRYFEAAQNVWCDSTWQDMATATARWQTALARDKLQVGERVAVMLGNCREWVMYEQAAQGLGLVVVPVFVNDRADNVAYILEDSGTKTLLIQGAEQWRSLQSIRAVLAKLTRIIALQPVAEPTANLVVAGEWLPTHGEFLQRDSRKAHDLATIVYTSGTTGRPKGVMLSHHNILWNAHSSMDNVICLEDDLFLSFLPLSHTLERTIGYYLPMMAGATVAYARSIPQLGDDLVSVKPTVLVTVPRIFERIAMKVRSALAAKGGVAPLLFEAAVHVGWHEFLRKQHRASWHAASLAWPVLQSAVAQKVLARFGGRIRVAVCGGASLGAQVAKTFVGLGLPIVQGYGLTETSPVVSVNRLEDNDPATVGTPLRDVKVRIGPDEELLVKGPGVMLGYWNNAAATRAVIDEEGWFHTGDKASIENGHVRITGRLKEIIVLANGEKVPPADMESALVLDPLVEQAMIVGEGRPFLGALLVLNPKEWETFLTHAGFEGDPAALLERERVKTAVIERIGKQLHHFPGYAQIRRVTLQLTPWSVENGLLTPTLKLRRSKIMECFAKDIAVLYSGHE